MFPYSSPLRPGGRVYKRCGGRRCPRVIYLPWPHVGRPCRLLDGVSLAPDTRAPQRVRDVVGARAAGVAEPHPVVVQPGAERKEDARRVITVADAGGIERRVPADARVAHFAAVGVRIGRGSAQQKPQCVQVVVGGGHEHRREAAAHRPAAHEVRLRLDVRVARHRARDRVRVVGQHGLAQCFLRRAELLLPSPSINLDRARDFGQQRRPLALEPRAHRGRWLREQLAVLQEARANLLGAQLPVQRGLGLVLVLAIDALAVALGEREPRPEVPPQRVAPLHEVYLGRLRHARAPVEAEVHQRIAAVLGERGERDRRDLATVAELEVRERRAPPRHGDHAVVAHAVALPEVQRRQLLAVGADCLEARIRHTRGAADLEHREVPTPPRERGEAVVGDAMGCAVVTEVEREVDFLEAWAPVRKCLDAGPDEPAISRSKTAQVGAADRDLADARVGELIVGRKRVLRDVELEQVGAEEAQIAVEHDAIREPHHRPRPAALGAVQPRELPGHEVAQGRAGVHQRDERVHVAAQAREQEVARELGLHGVHKGEPAGRRQAVVLLRRLLALERGGGLGPATAAAARPLRVAIAGGMAVLCRARARGCLPLSGRARAPVVAVPAALAAERHGSNRREVARSMCGVPLVCGGVCP